MSAKLTRNFRKKKKILATSYFPGRSSIIGSAGLDCWVRDGTRYNPRDIIARKPLRFVICPHSFNYGGFLVLKFSTLRPAGRSDKKNQIDEHTLRLSSQNRSFEIGDYSKIISLNMFVGLLSQRRWVREPTRCLRICFFPALLPARSCKSYLGKSIPREKKVSRLISIG